MDIAHIGPALRTLRDQAGMTRQDAATRFANLGRKKSMSTIRLWETTGSIRLDDAEFYVTRVLGFRWEEFRSAVEEQRRLSPRP